eukprot:XP_001704134.1 Hypothetical protein GL50803_31929 [Giardia lamblia ATCC 50803]
MEGRSDHMDLPIPELLVNSLERAYSASNAAVIWAWSLSNSVTPYSIPLVLVSINFIL